MITDLGSLGGNQNQALSINNCGQIVGLSQTTIPDPFSLYDFLIRLRVTGTNDATASNSAVHVRGADWDFSTLAIVTDAYPKPKQEYNAFPHSVSDLPGCLAVDDELVDPEVSA